MVLLNSVPSVIQIADWMLIMQTDGLKSLREVVSRLDAYHANNLAKVTRGSGVWSGMRIYQPNNIATQYYGEVINIETMRYPGRYLDAHHLRYRGRYLDAHHTKVALFTAPPGGDVSGLVWAEWTVRCGPEGTISLESVRYPDYYLDAHHSRDCKVTYSASTETYWNMWYMERRALQQLIGIYGTWKRQMMVLSMVLNSVPSVIQIAVWMLIMLIIWLKSHGEVAFGLE
jgi:hypothetical protein